MQSLMIQLETTTGDRAQEIPTQVRLTGVQLLMRKTDSFEITSTCNLIMCQIS